MQGDDNTVWVDIDETMLHLYQQGKRKLSPRDICEVLGDILEGFRGEKATNRPSFTCCVQSASPIERKFDGRVGLWAFANEELTEGAARIALLVFPSLVHQSTQKFGNVTCLRKYQRCR